MKNNFEYIKRLKKKGYRLFLLTNITKDSFNYINSVINLDDIFSGGVYSYREHLLKPDYDIYNLILDKYNLNKNETVFFDDKEKNVIAANEIGLKAFKFISIADISRNI